MTPFGLQIPAVPLQIEPYWSRLSMSRVVNPLVAVPTLKESEPKLLEGNQETPIMRSQTTDPETKTPSILSSK
jgi:hypothetical protein